MVDYKELCKALRNCSKTKDCRECTLYNHGNCYPDFRLRIAADAIEALQAEAEKLRLLHFNAERDATNLTGECMQLRGDNHNLQVHADHCESSRDAYKDEVERLKKKLDVAVADMTFIAGECTSALKCSFCVWNPNDMGCELDGSQFDDDGECHFEWDGLDQAKKKTMINGLDGGV